jgi:thiopeptide-type bacteriocin biosynthesis protein
MPLIADNINPLVTTSGIWKIQFDTYEREIERYGGLEGMKAAEDVFFIDSEATLEILEHSGVADSKRSQLALLSVDRLLRDFGLDLSARERAVTAPIPYLRRDLKIRADNTTFGDHFRANRASLEGLFRARSGGAVPSPIRDALDHRSRRLTEVIGRLRSLEEAGRINSKELLSSFVHLHVNRLMADNPRFHELTLYEFLSRVYRGALAREKAEEVCDRIGEQDSSIGPASIADD